MIGHMFGYGYPTGINWWWLVGFSILRLLVIIIIVVLIIKLLNKNRQEREIYNSSHKAIEILNERFASGEISEEEYLRKINILKSKY